MAAQSFPAAPANPEPLGYQGPRSNFMVPRIGDIIDDLPEPAAEKLRSLRQRAEDMGSLARSVMNAQEEQRIAKMGHQTRISRLMQARAAGGYNLEFDAPQVVAEQRLLDKTTKEYNRLNELSDVRFAQRNTLTRIIDRIEQWMLNGRPGGTALAIYESVAPVLKKGETITDAIEGRRRRIRELRADRHRVQSAPYPSSLAKQKMRAQIDAINDQGGAPNVLGLIENLTEIVFPTRSVMALVRNAPSLAEGGPGVVFVDVPDANALLAWVFRDALIKKLEAEIDECADDKAALTNDQRQQQESVILSDILATEREEVGLIDLATSQGINVEYRDDSDLRAVLGVMLVGSTD